MTIRRKSDAEVRLKTCRNYDQIRTDIANQFEHERRRDEDSGHDPAARCWCCCDDCADLTWHYPPRKGVWWRLSPSGEPQLQRESFDGSPG